MNEIRISIIIPVYNVEKYIKRCLDSILNQNYKNWECILINDGSEDSSGLICESYANADKRFKVVNKKNEGVSIARNIGLDKASGDVIVFVDSDDWMERDALETISLSWNEKYDVIIYSIYDALNEENRILRSFFKKDRIDFCDDDEYTIDILEKSMLTTYQECEKSFRSGALWGKAYNGEVIQKYRFDKDIYLHEDTCFNVKFVRENGKVLYINKPIYNYFLNMNSATTSAYKQNGEKILKNEMIAYEFMKKSYQSDDIWNGNFKDYLYLSIQTVLCWTAFEKNKEMRKKGREFCFFLSQNIKKNARMKRMPFVSKIVINAVWMRCFVVVEYLIRMKKKFAKR